MENSNRSIVWIVVTLVLFSSSVTGKCNTRSLSSPTHSPFPSGFPTPSTFSPTTDVTVVSTCSPSLAPSDTGSKVTSVPSILESPTSLPTKHPSPFTPSNIPPSTTIPTVRTTSAMPTLSIYQPSVLPTFQPSFVPTTILSITEVPTMITDVIEPTHAPTSYSFTSQPSASLVTTYQPSGTTISSGPTMSPSYLSISNVPTSQTISPTEGDSPTALPISASPTVASLITDAPSTNVESLAPSAEFSAPSAFPTVTSSGNPIPTSIPTSAGTEEVILGLEQIVTVEGVLTESFSVRSAFVYAVAASVQSLAPDSIVIESIANTSFSAATLHHASRSLRAIVSVESVSYVKFLYTIQFFVESLGYESSQQAVDDVVLQLNAAVKSGYFAQMLQYYAKELGADSSLGSATAMEVSLRYFTVINHDDRLVGGTDEKFPLFAKIILPLGVFMVLILLLYFCWDALPCVGKRLTHSRYRTLFTDGKKGSNFVESDEKGTENGFEQQLVNLLLNSEEEKVEDRNIFVVTEDNDVQSVQADPAIIHLDFEQNNEPSPEIPISSLAGGRSDHILERFEHDDIDPNIDANVSDHANTPTHTQVELVTITSPIIARRKEKSVAKMIPNTHHSVPSPAKQRFARLRRLSHVSSEGRSTLVRKSSIKDLILLVKHQTEQIEMHEMNHTPTIFHEDVSDKKDSGNSGGIA